MTIESQNSESAANEGLWREHETRFRDLMMSVWPSATFSEISSKISLQSLQTMIEAGSLALEHEDRLKSYLNSLPGYGIPGFENEAVLHHGYITAHLHRLGGLRETASKAVTHH